MSRKLESIVFSLGLVILMLVLLTVHGVSRFIGMQSGVSFSARYFSNGSIQVVQS